MKKTVTHTQLRALRALDPNNASYDPNHRPRNSLERLAKKGLVGGNRKSGWHLTVEGAHFLHVSGEAE
ncbi:MAG: hypothetical protein VXX11_03790 [Planctomycetota bacterium]|nr:hypothetical protein [Planctomycetota bacterium]